MDAPTRIDLVLAVARVLFVNGQSTDQTVATARRAAKALEIDAEILPQWGEIQLRSKQGGAQSLSLLAAEPAGINMGRVVAATDAIGDLEAGRLTPSAAASAIDAIAKLPPAPTWLFALAAGAGATALAVLFGVEHIVAAAIIFVSAAAGGQLLQFLLLAAVLIVSVITRPSSAPHGLTAGIAVMLAVAAIAFQYALFRLAVPGAVSTAVMTGNLTNTVLPLMDAASAGHPLMVLDPGRLKRSLLLLFGFLLGCTIAAAAISQLGDWAWAFPAALAAIAIVLLGPA
jgi:uncharacterized membrane protein YjjP (DUF1212 family)